MRVIRLASSGWLTDFTILLLLSLALCVAPAKADSPAFKIVGPPEVVYSWEGSRCAADDIPDESMRAFRASDGTVVAFATHYRNRLLVGPSLTRLHRECEVVYAGNENADPSAFDDRTWIASTWSNDGRVVYALGHNEYQAERFPGKCVFKTDAECLYVSLVLLRSDDGGRTFRRLDQGHPLPVAAPPFANRQFQGRRRGYSNPTNVLYWNGYYYVFATESGIDQSHDGTCLLRTAVLGNPAAWTYFDGSGFVSSAVNPYATAAADRTRCAPIENLKGLIGSIARIQGTESFVAFLGLHLNNESVGSVAVSYSKDLVHWSRPKAILKVPLFWSKRCSGKYRYNYISVLDDTVGGRNFDIVGEHPYLFMTRADCSIGLHRDLIRYQLDLIHQG
jgi:hypothetical protein